MTQGRAKYPWDQWFRTIKNGAGFTARYGQDYDLPTVDMQNMILAEARRRRVRVRTRRLADHSGVRAEPKAALRYNWDLWLNGEMHRLVEGKDFICKPESLARTARVAAGKRGLKVRTKHFHGAYWLQALDSNALE